MITISKTATGFSAAEQEIAMTKPAYAIIITRRYYGPTERRSLYAVGPYVPTYPSLSAAKAACAQLDRADYYLGHNESDRPTFTARRIDRLPDSLRTQGQFVDAPSLNSNPDTAKYSIVVDDPRGAYLAQWTDPRDMRVQPCALTEGSRSEVEDVVARLTISGHEAFILPAHLACARWKERKK